MLQNKTYKKIRKIELKINKMIFRGKLQNIIYANEKEFNRMKSQKI